MRNKKGFTLIELLVVVLIIGILAAIALPQYEKAVLKSRASQALVMLQSIIKAQDEYHLINGYYTNNLDELSISVPEGRRLGKMSDDEHKKIMVLLALMRLPEDAA
jgi:prepilin-type N-terminal cleavage/methylation domain-containing protein